MVETLFLIIIGAGIGLYQDMNQPTQFELNMEDGTHAEIVLQKNNTKMPYQWVSTVYHHLSSMGTFSRALSPTRLSRR